MNELTVRFGGPLWSVLDPHSGLKIEARASGDGVVRAIDEAKYASWLNALGGEAGAADAAKTLLLEHAGHVMQQRTAELGALKAVEGRGFAEALVLRANTHFKPSGAEVTIRELTVSLSPETVEALQHPPVAPQLASAPAAARNSPAAMMGVIGVLLVGGLVTWAAAKSQKSEGIATPTIHAAWDGTRAFRCGGHEEVAFGGIVSDLPTQTAIVAGEHCHLKLDGVRLTAATALEAADNAVIEVNGGTIEGTTLAAHAGGNARVVFKGVTVKGRTSTDDNGSITGP